MTDSASSEKKSKVFLQIDTEKHASSFDSIVALDAGADQILPFSDVQPEDVQGIVHGAMFTRSVRSLSNTMIFVGGSDVGRATENFEAVKKTLFPPLNNSVLFDPNGANTTATAAVWSALCNVNVVNTSPESSIFSNWSGSPDAIVKRDSPEEVRALVLGATGPVGRSVSKLLALSGLSVTLCSRSIEKASALLAEIQQECSGQTAPSIFATSNEQWFSAAQNEPFDLIFSCGAAGVTLIDKNQFDVLKEYPCVMVDLNAVPPCGIPSISSADFGTRYDECLGYGAIGVGNLKMQIHKKAIAECFEKTGHVFGAQELFQHADKWLS